MSVHHEVLVRVFGPYEAFIAAHAKILDVQIALPTYRFSFDAFDATMPQGYAGGVFRAERNQEAPLLARIDCTREPFGVKGMAVEVLHLIDDREYHSIYIDGQRVYDAQRQEETGGVYKLGDPTQKYVFSHEEGDRHAFVKVTQAAGIRRGILIL